MVRDAKYSYRFLYTIIKMQAIKSGIAATDLVNVYKVISLYFIITDILKKIVKMLFKCTIYDY